MPRSPATGHLAPPILCWGRRSGRWNNLARHWIASRPHSSTSQTTHSCSIGSALAIYRCKRTTPPNTICAALAGRQPFPEAEAHLGVTLVGQQRFVEAYPLLAAALDSGLGNTRRHRAMALTMIDANRLEDAERYLRKALAEDENELDRARVAWIAWRLGRIGTPRSDLQLALAL